MLRLRANGERMSRIEREVLEAQDKTKVLEYYRQMLAIRRLEEAAAKAYSQGKIGGFLHLYIGQEAVAVGATAALKPDDYVMTSYRDHGLAYAKGMSGRAIMAELFARETGCSKGLGRDGFEGFDVLRVRDRVAEAVKRARYQSEPTLIEILCYRFRGHSMSDPGLYRTKEEIEDFKKRDCLSIARGYLEQWGVDDKEFDAIEEKVR